MAPPVHFSWWLQTAAVAAVAAAEAECPRRWTATQVPQMELAEVGSWHSQSWQPIRPMSLDSRKEEAGAEPND